MADHRRVVLGQHARDRHRPATAPPAPRLRHRPKSWWAWPGWELPGFFKYLRTSGTTYGTTRRHARLLGREVEQPVVHEIGDVELVAAAGMKAAMSPVQPSRSSRCGQSVGTSRKLPIGPQTTLRCNWLSSSSESKVRSGAARSGRRRRTDHRRPALGPALDLGVAEAMEGEGRLERSRSPLKMNRSVAFAARSGADAEFAVLEHLRVAQGDLGTGRPLDTKRIHPTRFCPKSTSVLPAGEVQIFTGTSSVSRRVGGPIRGQRVEVQARRVDMTNCRRRSPTPARRWTRAARRWSARRIGRSRSPLMLRPASLVGEHRCTWPSANSISSGPRSSIRCRSGPGPHPIRAARGTIRCPTRHRGRTPAVAAT